MVNRLRLLCPELNIVEDADMGKYTTFRCGGKADFLIEVKDMDELKKVLSFLKSENIKWFFLGNGSNTLFSDEGFSGVVLKFSDEGEFKEISYDGTFVTAGAGVLMSSFAKSLMEHSLTGFEPMSGIPGTVGGACFMNAGAYEKSISDVIVSTHGVNMDGVEKDFYLPDMDLSYRHSAFEENGFIVTSAKFMFEEGDGSEILEKMKDYAHRRNSKQPVNFPSAGSTFKRPTGYFAGKLIEDSGLKGYRVGGAEVSTLHAGFVINRENATATDVITLIHDVQKKVYKDTGVMLEPEVRII